MNLRGEEMKIKAWRVLFLVLTLAVMIIIFAFSSQSADLSGDLSEGVTRSILPFLEGASPEVVERFNHIIRKCAHAFIYALLGCFAAGFSLTYRDGKRSVLLLAAAGWLFAVLYAGSDELHQMFVPGRGPAISDVLLDSCGAAVGAAAAWLWERCGKNKEKG